MTRTIGIYLFDEVEVLDFAGPFEVFSTASRVKKRIQPDASAAFEVLTIAEKLRPITARGGLTVQPQFAFETHPALDILIVPGGVVTEEMARAEVLGWITRTASAVTITASVCTGAFLLGQAGLLDGRPATTHWEDIADLRSLFPAITIRYEARWVDAGNIVTSAGIAAGIDMSLHLVARLEGDELALRTARQMDFPWLPSKS